jgi:AcrR family transcriptional regulator
MAVDATQPHEGSAVGRPRDELREQAILDAAVELVAEVGYDCFSMDTLAARARASKATIYRRWSGKAEVVAEAVRRRASHEDVPVPDTGSLREDLVAYLTASCDAMMDEDAALIAGVTRAMRLDPELAALMRTHVIESKHAVTAAMIERAVARGELPGRADAGLLNEVFTALVLNRLLLSDEPLDCAFVAHLVNDIAMPLLLQ